MGRYTSKLGKPSRGKTINARGLTQVSIEDLEHTPLAPEHDDYNDDDIGNDDDYGAGEDVTDYLGDDAEVAPVDTSETPEALEAAVDEEASDLTAEGDELDKINNATAQMESIYLSMLATHEAGYSFEERSMEFVYIGLENALAQLPEELSGLNVPKASQVSQEGVVGQAIERVGEKLAFLRQKIKLRISKYMQNTRDFFKSWTPLIDRMLKRAEAIKEKIADADWGDMEKTFRFARANDMQVEGRAPNPETVIKTAQAWASCMDDLFSKQAEDRVMSGLTDIVKAVNRDGGLDKAGLFSVKLWISNSAMPDLFKLFPNIAAKETTSAGGIRVRPDYLARRSEVLFGNQVFVIGKPRPTKETDELDLSLTPAIFKAKVNTPKLTTSQIQALNRQQTEKLLGIVIEQLQNARGYWKLFSDRNNKMEQFMREAWLETRGANLGGDKLDLAKRGALVRHLAHSYKTVILDGREEGAKNLKYQAGLLISLIERTVKHATKGASASSGEEPSSEGYTFSW